MAKDQLPLQVRLLPDSLPSAATESEWITHIRWEWPWVAEEAGCRFSHPGVWVDLKSTPESNTGYNGSKVWEAIYNENCIVESGGSECIEEILLRQLVSILLE